MQLLWLHLVQNYLVIGFKFYFKKFNAVYLEKIPKDKAVVFLSNHQNALLDPLLITLKSKRKNYFLTRAAVFKNPRVAKILNSLQMLPVYRVIDGVDIREKNKEIFTKSSNLLSEKKSIILFPEGNHNLKRRVRPLKKGFSRIIDETFQKDPTTEIIIIPIGVNYQNPTSYGDEISVHFGNHINPVDFWKNEQLDFLGLSERVSNEMKTLTTHIESLSEYDTIHNKLVNQQIDFTNPEAVNTYLSSDIHLNDLKRKKKDSSLYSVFSFFVKLFYIIPYWVWKKVVFPKIKEDEFIGTFRFATIISITPIYLLVLSIVMFLSFGKTIALVFFSTGIILPLFTLRIK